MLRPASDSGFSLVEVLVALAVLAVAGAAFMRFGAAHVNRLDRLETRMAADLIAENTLVGLRMMPETARPQQRELHMMARHWTVDISTTATEDPELLEIDIAVSEADAGVSTSELKAFIDVGPVR